MPTQFRPSSPAAPQSWWVTHMQKVVSNVSPLPSTRSKHCRIAQLSFCSFRSNRTPSPSSQLRVVNACATWQVSAGQHGSRGGAELGTAELRQESKPCLQKPRAGGWGGVAQVGSSLPGLLLGQMVGKGLPASQDHSPPLLDGISKLRPGGGVPSLGLLH